MTNRRSVHTGCDLHARRSACTKFQPLPRRCTIPARPWCGANLSRRRDAADALDPALVVTASVLVFSLEQGSSFAFQTRPRQTAGFECGAKSGARRARPVDWAMAFRALHINAAESDFTGNAGRGRYFLLPGSRSRAAAIANSFRESRSKTHGRGHDLHLGVVERDGLSLDVGVISTGMGCPSVDLIVTELIALGAQVMVRVGTCGSLQPHIQTGDIIAATAAVRDEGTTRHYLPPEVPALPSFDLVRAMIAAGAKSTLAGLGVNVHFGPVHTKDSLYAREMGFGPLKKQHVEYQELLTKAGVVASEMECAQLFVLGTLGPLAEAKTRVHTGAVLAVIGDHDVPFKESSLAETAVDRAIEFALDSLVAFHRL